MKFKKNKALTFSLTIFLTGCMNLAPEYEQPNTPMAERWVGEALQMQKNGVAPSKLGWREFFLDAQLHKLIETALINNHDLRKAALNVELSEQQHGITRVANIPTVNFNGSVKRRRGVGEQYQVGVGLSNYELDFFGRVKNQSEASLNKYLQTQEARDAAKLSIIKGISQLYYRWRGFSELRDLSKSTLQSRQKSYELIKLRFQEGLSAGTDVTRSLSLVASAESAYQKQLRSVLQIENAMSTLVGTPISGLVLPPANPMQMQFSSKTLFAGLPSKVLLNRPDIRQAEFGLKAENANIGAARARMYPSITLTGNLGYVSPQFGNLFESPARMWSFGPALELPIFDSGKRKANIKITELQQKIAVENYQSTVQRAFQEVADALIARKTLIKQYQAEVSGLKATDDTLRMVKSQVKEGLANGLNLLDAKRASFGARQGLMATQLDMLINKVDLYIALGGGLHDVYEAPLTPDVSVTPIQTMTQSNIESIPMAETYPVQ